MNLIHNMKYTCYIYFRYDPYFTKIK